MKAILRYGKFIQVLEVREVHPIITVIKPPMTDYKPESNIDTSTVETTALEFRLKESPKIGEMLQYEFIGEK